MPAKNKILVVDDEEALRVVLSAELEGEGYQVTSAADGQEAINILTTKGFDLILLDIKMPHITGDELLPRIVADFPEAPVIIITGADDVETAVKCMKAGAFDYLVKPVPVGVLLAHLNSLTRRLVAKKNFRNNMNIKTAPSPA